MAQENLQITPVEVFTPASWGEDNTESSEGTDSTETTGEGGAS